MMTILEAIVVIMLFVVVSLFSIWAFVFFLALFLLGVGFMYVKDKITYFINLGYKQKK